MLKARAEAVEQAATALPPFARAWIAARVASGGLADGEAALAAVSSLTAFLDWLRSSGRSRATTSSDVSIIDARLVDDAGLAAFSDAKPDARDLAVDLVAELRAPPPPAPGRGPDLRDPATVAREVFLRREAPLIIVTAARPEDDLFPQLSDLQVVAGPWVTGRATVRTPEGIWDLDALLARLPLPFREATLLVHCDPQLRHRPRNLAVLRGRRLLVAEATELRVPQAGGLARLLSAEPFDGLVHATLHPVVDLLARQPSAPPRLLLPGLFGRHVSAHPDASAPGAPAYLERQGVLVVASGATPLPAARAFADKLEAALSPLLAPSSRERRVRLAEGPLGELTAEARRHLAVVRFGGEVAPDAIQALMARSGALPFAPTPPLATGKPEALAPNIPYASLDELARKLAEVLRHPGKAAPLAARLQGTSAQVGWLAETRRRLWTFAGDISARAPLALDAASRAHLEHFDALRAHAATAPATTLLHLADALPAASEHLAALPSVRREPLAPSAVASARGNAPRVASLPLAALRGPLPAWCRADAVATLLVEPPPDALGLTDDALRTLVAGGFDLTADHDFVFSGRDFPAPSPEPATPLDPPWVLRPLGPAPRGERTLKLYIDSATLPVIHQMADFLRCEFDPDVYKLVTWRRFPISPEEAAASQTVYFHQLANVSRDFVGLACALVTELRPARVEIHTNHIWALGGLAPVLRAFVRRRLIDPSRIDLHIYGDGTWELRDRDAMGLSGRLGDELEAAAERLADLIFGPVERSSDQVMNYGWHRLFRTVYHGLAWDRFFDRVRPQLRPGCRLEAATRAMRFDYAQTLPPDLWRRYLAKMGLSEDVQRSLRELAARPGSFMYVALALWDPAANRYFRDLQLATIRRLRAEGLIPAGSLIAYKGHPGNPEYDGDLIAALSEEGGAALEVPRQAPLEVLEMAGLLPEAVGGSLSSSFHTIDPSRIRFLCGPDTAPETVRLFPDNRILIELGRVKPEQVLPWYS
jgi:hypothetical protein